MPLVAGGLPYLSDKSAGNLRVSSFWRDQVEREKERYKHLNAEFQRIERRDKKAFFSNQCKEIEENKNGKD